MPATASEGERRRAEPDWAHVHHEPRRPGVTLKPPPAEPRKYAEGRVPHGSNPGAEIASIM
jgi:transposase